MLVDAPGVMNSDPILKAISALSGNVRERRIQEGVYEIGHFGSSDFLRGTHNQYPELSVNAYGVCDTVEQLLAAAPELEAPGRQFTVTVTPIRKAEQPESGGWRWRKWGPYIGTKPRTAEYLYNEPVIDEVLVYHIYEERVDGTA